jgi:hypothetical protein
MEKKKFHTEEDREPGSKVEERGVRRAPAFFKAPAESLDSILVTSFVWKIGGL